MSLLEVAHTSISTSQDITSTVVPGEETSGVVSVQAPSEVGELQGETVSGGTSSISQGSIGQGAGIFTGTVNFNVAIRSEVSQGMAV
jgi:hypothetical protein